MLGERQVLPGYCLLLPDPVVPTLNALQGAERAAFLADMAALGDAVLAVTHAVRINYAIFGNLDPALHAHVIPRYHDEPAGAPARRSPGPTTGTPRRPSTRTSTATCATASMPRSRASREAPA